MSQTQLDYNALMFGANGEPFRLKSATIQGAVDLLKGSILTRSGVNTYHAAIDADKIGAAEIPNDWVILLEDAAVSGGDVTAKVGTSGGIFEDKAIAVTGLTYDADVAAKLAGSNIYVQGGTNSMAIAGEGA
jgi:hypothetical protein